MNRSRPDASSAAATAAPRHPAERMLRSAPKPALGRRSIACAATIVIGCLLQVAFLWHTSQIHSLVLLGATTTICAISIICWNLGIRRWLPRRSMEMLMLWVIAGLIAAAIIWNLTYRGYAKKLPLTQRREIFRPALDRPFTPVYGTPQHFNLRNLLLCGLGGAALCAGAGAFVAATRRRKKPERAAAWAALLVAQLIAIGCFAIAERPPRLGGKAIGGYFEFQRDLPHFAGPSDLLRNYVRRMHMLDWYNRHYPPGNLLLFMAERRLGADGAVKLIVTVTAILGSIALYLLAAELGLGEFSRRLAASLFGCSAAVVVFTTVTTTPLVLLPTICFALFAIRAMRTGRRCWALLAAGALLIFWFLSFTFVMPMILGAIFAAMILLRGQARARHIAGAALWCAAGVLIGIALVRAASGFDLAACLATAMRLNHFQQKSDPFHPWQAWLLRSTGNLLAYLISIAPLAAFAAWSIKRPRNPFTGSLIATARSRLFSPSPGTPGEGRGEGFRATQCCTVSTRSHALAMATMLSILLAGFCGLFWLETERIWIFFTPFVALAAAAGIRDYLRRERDSFAVAACIIGAVAFVAVCELAFMPYRP